jgi:glycosyltransferase involved in cell wall biosynthesis
MKVAILTTDNREHFKSYHETAPHFGTAPEALLQGFETMPDTELHIVSCIRQAVAAPQKLAPNIWFHSLHVPRLGWTATAFQGCIRAARRKLHEINPDIVHGQGTERDCAISAIFSGFKNVVTIHGNMQELARLFKAPVGSFGWFAAHLETFTLKRTSGVFCNSEYTENLVKPRTPKTWRVPNPIRKAFFDTPKTAVAKEKCFLINVGLISPRKRQIELLEVARRVHEMGLRLELQFIGGFGSGAYSDTFREKIKEAEAKGYARHIGFKSTAELIATFDAVHGLVHFPSEEAFGLVVAEGMARDLKFFGSRLGGIIDITNGVPGAELFGAQDWDGLANGIANWIRAGHPRANGAAAIMAERYHPTVIARRHLEIYNEVLNDGR